MNDEVPMIDTLPHGGVAVVERSPDGRYVYVHDQVFERYSCPSELRQYVPAIDPNYTYDRAALEVLYGVATAEKYSVPWLFDGRPGTSKTSSILQFYALLNRPVLRMNCRGHTDTSELIGKFLPSESHLQDEFLKLSRRCGNDELFLNTLEPEARDLFLEMRGGKVLTLEQTRRFTELCGLDADGAEWRWQDGAVPFCMKNGLVLLLDEADLARQEVLQGATNSVLERDPTLMIPEHQGETIRRMGGGAEAASHVYPLHEHFRIFATRNPMDESRIPFGLPYKDRWGGRTVVSAPSQDDTEQRLRRRVFKEQPAIQFRGVRYSSHTSVLPPRREYNHSESVTRTAHAQLHSIPNFSNFLEKLADLHTQAALAAENREIGKSGMDAMEGLIFTQRSLDFFMTFLERRTAFDRWRSRVCSTQEDPTVSILTAFELFYLNRCSDNDDRIKLTDMLSAIGLSLENWQHQHVEGHRTLLERDPKRLLEDCDRYFALNATGVEHRSLDHWPTVASDDGMWVDMRMPAAAEELPPRFFDLHGTGAREGNGYLLKVRERQSRFQPVPTAFAGKEKLLKFLQNKTVYSVIVDMEQEQRLWFLQCLSGTSQSVP